MMAECECGYLYDPSVPGAHICSKEMREQRRFEKIEARLAMIEAAISLGLFASTNAH